ncbi:MAG TPA: hypothetical protein VF376_12245 [Thermoanaerobaculia bacterium]
MRATLVWRQPDLSDDAHRYLWDGRVARAGISPYAYAPDDPALSRIDPVLRSRVAHRDIRTVYPPAAQAVFRVFGGGGNLFLLKSFLAAADLAIVALLWSSGGRGNRFAAALYAFHPLPITEIAGEGHVDALGAALLLASLLFVASHRRVASGLALALSIMTKYVAIAAALPIFRRGRAACVLSALAVSSVVWLGAARGATPLGGLGQFATRWDFNSVLYPAAVRVMEASGLPETAKDLFIEWKDRRNPAWAQRVFPYFYPEFFARVLLAGILAAVLGAVAIRVRDLETAVFASLGALLLFSPTLHPWYLVWILPLAARRRDPAFLFLSFVIPISYALAFPLPGVPAALVLPLEYAPFAILLCRSLGLLRSERTAEAMAS